MLLFPQETTRFPRFDLPLQTPGYRWWYIDAASNDHSQAITVIAFRGSVFSPYYRQARKRQRAHADNHVALNVAVYGRGGKRWAMTERGHAALHCEPQLLRIGASQLHWHHDQLIVDINERCAPLPRRLRGQLRIRLGPAQPRQFLLDARHRHAWWPLAPLASIEVDLSAPQQQWQGRAYVDSNAGSEPLEQAFAHWDWCRTADLHDEQNDAMILYNRTLRDGSQHRLALHVNANGEISEQPAPASAALPTSFWRLPRNTGSDTSQAELLRTLESAPFYARSLIRTTLQGQPRIAMHENLDCQRLIKTSTQLMLPFRMPRWPW